MNQEFHVVSPEREEALFFRSFQEFDDWLLDYPEQVKDWIEEGCYVVVCGLHIMQLNESIAQNPDYYLRKLYGLQF